MEGAAKSTLAEGKKVSGELWGWSKVGGKTVFTKMKEIGHNHGGKIGLAVTLATAATAEGGLVEELSDSLAPNTKPLVEKGEKKASKYVEAAAKDVVQNYDPGVGLIVNHENGVRAGQATSDFLLPGSGDYGDYSQEHRYDVGKSVSGMWQGIKDFFSGN